MAGRDWEEERFPDVVLSIGCCTCRWLFCLFVTWQCKKIESQKKTQNFKTKASSLVVLFLVFLVVVDHVLLVVFLPFVLHAFSVLVVLVSISDFVVFCLCFSTTIEKEKLTLVLFLFLVWNKQTHLQQLNNFGMPFLLSPNQVAFDQTVNCVFDILSCCFWLVLTKKNKFWFFWFLIGICNKYKNHIKTVHKFDAILTISSWIYLEILVFGWNSHHIGQHTHTHTMFILFPTTTIELRK